MNMKKAPKAGTFPRLLKYVFSKYPGTIITVIICIIFVIILYKLVISTIKWTAFSSCLFYLQKISMFVIYIYYYFAF